MKGLSIEEKARAYDEARKKIAIRFGSNVADEIFPELKESEDEMIRRVLYEIVLQWKNGHQAWCSDNKEIDTILAWLEKQSEQKPADKVELKFKVGDWVTINPELRFASPLCIRDIDNNNYRVESADGNSGAPTIDYLDNHYHLWTIQDAKDGDVLSWDDSKCIALFKNIYDKDSFNSHGLVGHCTGTFEPRQAYHDIEGAHPATKEQRDALMKAMADTGYTFDFGKKELKKIKQKPQRMVSAEAKEAMYDKPAWSEEDIVAIDCAVEVLSKDLPSLAASIERLKSLKDRVQPKQKWSEEGKQYLKIEGYENLSDYEKIFDDIADKYVRNKNQKGYNQSWYVKERAAEMLYHAKKELEKKESWSEEDGDIRDNVIRDLKRLSCDMVSPNQTYQKEIQWLKSLRPQNRWKPSDEQINTLQDAIVYVEGYNSNIKGSGSVLEKLYRDLKKLREE